MLCWRILFACLGLVWVRSEVTVQGKGKISYQFVVPDPESVMTCENINYKASKELQKTVKDLSEQIHRLNNTTGPVFNGGFPVSSGTAPNANQKCECRCNAKVDFHFEYRDCQDVKELSPLTLSGVYSVFPITRVEHLLITNSNKGVKGKYWSVKTEGPLPVYCELSSSMNRGWTVLQRRTFMDTSFNRTWSEYRKGFGQMEGGDFWLGLEKMHKITSQKFLNYILRITLWLTDGGIPSHSDFPNFRVASEAERYKVSLGTGTGSHSDFLKYINGGVFSTFDRDHDDYGGNNCAKNVNRFAGGGWWFKGHGGQYCGFSNLNAFKPYKHSTTFKFTEMKLRPINV